MFKTFRTSILKLLSRSILTGLGISICLSLMSCSTSPEIAPQLEVKYYDYMNSLITYEIVPKYIFKDPIPEEMFKDKNEIGDGLTKKLNMETKEGVARYYRVTFKDDKISSLEELVIYNFKKNSFVEIDDPDGAILIESIAEYDSKGRLTFYNGNPHHYPGFFEPQTYTYSYEERTDNIVEQTSQFLRFDENGEPMLKYRSKSVDIYQDGLLVKESYYTMNDNSSGRWELPVDPTDPEMALSSYIIYDYDRDIISRYSGNGIFIEESKIRWRHPD